MSFILSGTDLANNIGKIVRVTGKSAENIIISNHPKDKNKINLKGYSNSGRFISLDMAAKVENPFATMVPTERFKSVIENRKEIQFNPRRGSIQYKSLENSYNGQIETEEVEKIEFPWPDKGARLSTLSPVLKTALFDLFNKIQLSSVFIKKDMIALIEIEEQMLRLASADDFHLALTEKPLGGNIKPAALQFPFVYQEVINAAFNTKADQIKMTSDSSRMYIMSADTLVSVPLLDIGKDEATMAGIIEHVYGSKKAKPDCEFIVNVDAIRPTLENMTGIDDPEKNAEIHFVLNNRQLSLQMESKYGKIKESLLVDVKTGSNAEFWSSPVVVEDVLKKISDKVSIKFLNNGQICLIGQQKDDLTSHYIIVGIKHENNKRRKI